MLLVKESRKDCGQPADGLRMSEWCGCQEDMMAGIMALNESLGSQEFKDKEISPVTAGCCGCASGQAAVMNFCKWER
jgi:hypothetical protein